MERGLKIFTIIIFQLLLAAIATAGLMGGNKKYSELEKRNLQRRPKVTINTIFNGEFQSKYSNYMSDQFVLRDSWVQIKTAANLAMQQRETNGVYFGKDNYLIEKYSNSDFDKNNIKDNVKYVSDFVNIVADNMGQDHITFMLVPGKANALCDKMPLYADKTTMNTYMEKLLKNKIDASMLIDLKDIMRKHQDEYIYYRNDHHWTTLGAYYAYAGLKEKKGQTYKKYSEYETQSVSNDFYGTTYDKVHLKLSPDIITKVRIPEADNCRVTYNDSGDITKADSIYYDKYLKEADKYLYFFGGNYSTINIHSGCTNGKTLLLIKDSYANCLVPYLTQDYENIVMIDLRYVNSSISDILAETEKIDDVLIAYNEEKFMQDSHQYNLQ